LKRFSNLEINSVKRTIEKSSYLSGYSNKFLGGEEIQKFEKNFARRHGCKYGVALNSGTSALFVAMKAAGIKKNQKVIVPALSFTATVSQVLACNAIPIFTDIDKKTYCLDYTSNNKSSKFAIPVHLLGHPCNFEMIKNMMDDGKFVIEDCAQATGAKYKNKSVGSIGNCGIFSFQETKHITTLGEGGMIVTNNEEFLEQCQNIRNHGEYYRDKPFIGYNFRMTEAQAAFGNVQLKKLDKIIHEFRKNAYYILKKLPDSILAPEIEKNIFHSFFILGCMYNQKIMKVNKKNFLDKVTKNRKKILENDSKSDIKGINFKPGKIIGAGYSKPLYKIPLYKKYKPKKICSNSESFVKNSIFLDIHRWRTRSQIDEELEILIQSSKNFYK
jgi:perosamine synthetase